MFRRPAPFRHGAFKPIPQGPSSPIVSPARAVERKLKDKDAEKVQGARNFMGQNLSDRTKALVLESGLNRMGLSWSINTATAVGQQRGFR